MFQGDTAVEILGQGIKRKPDITLGASLECIRCLRWCLEKERKDRLAAIGDARRHARGRGTRLHSPCRQPPLFLKPAAALETPGDVGGCAVDGRGPSLLALSVERTNSSRRCRRACPLHYPRARS